MKPAMRQRLAREPFDQKIRRVAQLVALTRSFPRRTARERAEESEDAVDVAALKRLRKKPLKYRPLEEYLSDKEPA
jgi:hypothetical protein